MGVKVLLDNWLLVPLDKIVMSSRNYKDKDDFMQERLETSIKRIGQVENIQVRELETGFFEIVNGNHRYEAFKNMGQKKVIVYNHGKISESEAERRAIETNETKFKANMVKLAGMIKDMQLDIPAADLALTMPFKEAEFINMQNLLDFNWSSQKSEGNNDTLNKDAVSGEENLNANRTVILKLHVDIAEGLEYQMQRVKKLLFPDNLPEHVADSAAIQAIVSVLTHVSDKTFEQ